MTSVVARPLADGSLTVHIEPDTTLETPVYVADARGRDARQVDADHFHRDRCAYRRAKIGRGSFLRAMNGSMPGAAH